MIAIAAIAIAAGAASALMYASIISGAMISLVLLNLAPLPLMVAAIGWGPLTAAIGGIAATTAIGLLFGSSIGFQFAIGTALPAWWLGHLLLLGRAVETPAGNGATPPAVAIEWYPSGRLLLWIAAMGAPLALWSLFKIDTDPDVITATIRKGAVEVASAFAGRGYPVDENLADTMAAIVPIGIPTLFITKLMLNLWLAAKIAVTSGRLNRPWPDLKSTALPQMTSVALCVAIAFCFAGGLPALIAKVVTGALLAAYGFTGLAVLHTLTLASSNRVVWLILTYAATIMLVWPLYVMAALALADAAFGFRERFMRTRPPPLPVA